MTNTIQASSLSFLPAAMVAAACIIIIGASLLLAESAHAAISSDLEIGSSGSDVTELQQFLATDASIYPQGIISGYFGSLTAAAVSRFQAAHGLPSVGRVGPLTRAAINAQLGGSVSLGGDIFAPTQYPETVTTSANSATISWATNEAANNRVMYGATWPFFYATAPSTRSAGFGSTGSMTLTGLQPHSTYYYVRESIDGAGNIMWTTSKTLATQ